MVCNVLKTCLKDQQTTLCITIHTKAIFCPNLERSLVYKWRNNTTSFHTHVLDIMLSNNSEKLRAKIRTVFRVQRLFTFAPLTFI